MKDKNNHSPVPTGNITNHTSFLTHNYGRTEQVPVENLTRELERKVAENLSQAIEKLTL